MRPETNVASTSRRRALALLGTSLAVASTPLRAALFGPDVLDVEVGTSTTGVLDPKSSRRLQVRTRSRTREIRWVDRNGRVVDSSSQVELENKYDWQTSVLRSTDIWQVTAEDLKEPAALVLRVRSAGVPLVVSLFPGVESARNLDPEAGYEVTSAAAGVAEWLALFVHQPQRKTFITVQAEETERVQYRLSVLKAERFRR